MEAEEGVYVCRLFLVQVLCDRVQRVVRKLEMMVMKEIYIFHLHSAKICSGESGKPLKQGRALLLVQSSFQLSVRKLFVFMLIEYLMLLVRRRR